MYRITIFLATFIILACFGVERSLAAPGFVLDRALPFPTGEGNVEAIGYGDDGFLWIDGRDTDQIYRLRPSDGAVLQSFSDTGIFIADLDVFDGTLYGLSEPNLLRFDTTSGLPLSSLPGPVSGGARGLTILDGDLYVSGVIQGSVGEVNIGRIDPATGNVLAIVAAPNLTSTASLGRVGNNLGYLVRPNSYAGDVTLNLIDSSTGQLLSSDVLFSASGNPWGFDASDNELFVTRRDLNQILVYTIIPEPTSLMALTFGSMMCVNIRRARSF